MAVQNLELRKQYSRELLKTYLRYASPDGVERLIASIEQAASEAMHGPQGQGVKDAVNHVRTRCHIVVLHQPEIKISRDQANQINPFITGDSVDDTAGAIAHTLDWLGTLAASQSADDCDLPLGGAHYLFRSMSAALEYEYASKGGQS